jgi:cyanophycinase
MDVGFGFHLLPDVTLDLDWEGLMGWTRKALIVLALFSLPAVSAEPVVKGPEHGALVIVGGGKVGADILGRMFELAGGKDAPLVVIPTANGQDEVPADWSGLKMFKDFGATNITVVHTKDRAVADSEAFVRPITTAKIVWFVGGRRCRRRIVGRRVDPVVVHGPRRP